MKKVLTLCVLSSLSLITTKAIAQNILLSDSMVEAIVQTRQVQSKLETENEILTIKVEHLSYDTAQLKQTIRDLTTEKNELENQVNRFKNGIFLGLGFGFNYFFNNPQSYYVKPDSTLGTYGRTNGMSFILSGFMAYKISEKNSLIFNVPLGDVTNRDEFKIGLFNQKMAGGIGFGRNLGNVSLIGIINISPYEQVEYELIKNEKFEYEKFTKITPDDLPSTTRYSPSITFGFSYNFLPEKSPLKMGEY
ncbi:MAG: hypothetical protein H6607_03120 [Flavobacteriales bacterium]|nr:hypothetical protein [Flavobacteriales bacterium]